MRKILITFLVPVMFALMIGCASSPKPVVINEYKMSSVHEDFPVPEQAVEREATFGNPNITEGAKYELENIGGEQGLYPPKAYLEKINASGWTEIEEERLGHVHFFKKDDAVVALEVQEDSIGVYELKQDTPLNQSNLLRSAD